MVHKGAPAEAELVESFFVAEDSEITEPVEQDDKPRDECGVFAISAPGRPVGAIAFAAADSLDHRGHSATGIAYNFPAENRVIIKKGFGKPYDALPGMIPHDGLTPAEVVGATMAIAHNRYSTDESDSLKASHPFESHGLVLAYNGHLPEDLGLLALEYGIDAKEAISDSELLTQIIGLQLAQSNDIARTLATVLGRVKGAYNIVMQYRDQIIAVRDPWGVHPLSVGVYPNGKSGVVASETVALDEAIVGQLASVRDIRPGEAVFMGSDGIKSVQLLKEEKSQYCLLESIYTTDEKSVAFGSRVREGRVNMGRRLGGKEKLTSGIVVAVPDSGIPGAEGFAEATGLPLVPVIVKSPEIGRTFLSRGEQQLADLRKKFIYAFDPEAGQKYFSAEIAATIEGQDVYLVDDSMIRGNSNARVIEEIRKANPKSIHIRLVSPPIKGLCNLGTDISDISELIAAGRTLEEIAVKLGVDSVSYNTFDDCEGAINDARLAGMPSLLGKFCQGCTLEKYFISTPVSVPRKNLNVLGQRVLARAS